MLSADEKKTTSKKYLGLLSPESNMITPNRLAIAIPALIGLTTIGLGVTEGYIRSHDLPYSLAYGLFHFIPNMVWSRINPIVIGQIVGVAQESIKTLSASETVIAETLFSIRSALASSTLLGYATAGLVGLGEAGKKLQERILNGEEPVRPHKESLIVLGGSSSSVLEALADSEQNILPIVELPEAMNGITSHIPQRQRGQKPFFLTIRDGKYKQYDYQRNVQLSQRSLIKTKEEKYLLVTFGDGSVFEEEFPFRSEPLQDLTIKELQIASRELYKTAQAKKLSVDGLVRIYLGDGNLVRKTGSGKHLLTLREEVDKYQSVDVFIDSKTPLIEAIMKKLGDSKSVIFHTKNQDYFKTAKKLLKKKGITVFDQEDQDVPPDAPVLVYEETTAETVERTVEIKEALKKEAVFALTSTIEGHRLAEVSGVEDVCTAEVYKEIVLKVMVALKEGKTPKEIQAELDNK